MIPVLKKGKSSEIRGGLWEFFLGKLAGYFLWFLSLTWKYTYSFQGVAQKKIVFDDPVLFLFWHNRVVVMPTFWRKHMRSTKLAFLSSASKDGAIAASAVSVFDIRGIRGSSSRRGVAALVKMMKVVREGYSIAIAPDGPRGPIYTIKGGVFRLSGNSRIPMVAVKVSMKHYWTFNSWDKMRLPYPFAKIHFELTEPIFAPQNLTEQQALAYSTQMIDLISDDTDLPYIPPNL